MPSRKDYSAPRRKGPSTASTRVHKSRRVAASGGGECRTNPGSNPSRPIPIDPDADLGEVNPIPCRACAVDTGQCHAIIGVDEICWGCRDRSRECEPLPQEATQNGKALTAAMVSGADRFTTALLTENLRSLLGSLENDSEDEESQEASRNGWKLTKNRSSSGRYHEGYQSWLEEGEQDYIGSDEEGIDDANNRDPADENGGVNKEPDRAPAEHVAADVAARRIRLKRLVGEIIDLLVH